MTEACSFLHYKDMDTENLRGQVVGAYEQGADAVVALVVILLGELAAQRQASLVGWSRQQAPPPEPAGGQWTEARGATGA